jgi:uncharacterized protein
LSIFFRFILELVMIVIVITVLRSVIGVVLKFLGGLGAKPAPAPKRPAVPTGGELKKDPVCGTFISTSGALQKTVRGEVYYFCSPECRDKFKG